MSEFPILATNLVLVSRVIRSLTPPHLMPLLLCLLHISEKVFFLSLYNNGTVDILGKLIKQETVSRGN